MALPKSIQQQAEAADAMVEQVALAEAASQPPVVDPQTGEPLTAQPRVVEPVPPVASDGFEQKYRTLQGKYDSEVPLLRSQLQNYERMNGTLSAQVASLSDQVRILTEQPRQTAPVAGNVTDADVAQYGSELIDLVRRVAGEAVGAQGSRVHDLVAREIGNVRQDVQLIHQNQTVTNRAAYNAGLTAAVPNWEQINATPEWRSWLAEYDPLIGSTRQAAVSAAYDAYDVPRTVAFLQKYIQVRPAPARTPQEELALQVTPRGTPSGTTPYETTPSGNGRIWTQDEIAEAYRHQIQDRNRLSKDGWAALEAEINQAVAEGRVR